MSLHHCVTILLFFFSSIHQYQTAAGTTTLAILNTTIVDPVVVAEDGEGACPTQEKRDAVQQDLTNPIAAAISSFVRERSKYKQYFEECGPGVWYQLAHLDMSDPSQQCPSAWREYNSSGVRACGRPDTGGASCPGVMYLPNDQYSRVCGRAIGYQYGNTDAFGNAAISQSLNSYYVYGVSITHGTPRNHIWTYAAGLTEGLNSCVQCNCPCADPDNQSNAIVPSFIGDNYYCESGNPSDTYIADFLYSSDPLWDGEQCEGQCCSNGKSPPWFSVELPNPTTDDIEVRICTPQGSFDDVAVQLLEIYIQ